MRARFLFTITLLGVSLFAAPAEAAASTSFSGAGYSVRDAASAVLTFRVPRIDCSAGAPSMDIGLSAPDDSWHGYVTMRCYRRHQSDSMEVFGSGLGIDEIDGGPPGHLVRFAVAPSGDHREISAADLTTGELVGTRPIPAGSRAAAGLDAWGGAAPFPTCVMQFTVDGGRPFTSVQHWRHVQTRAGTTIIGTGNPWRDGRHFALYFKHR